MKCLPLIILFIACVAVAPLVPTSAGIIFSEDFEGLSDGDLVGQGGWTGDSLWLATDPSPLMTRVADGFRRVGSYTQHATVHSLTLPSTGQVFVTLDAYARSTFIPSNNSGFMVGDSDGPRSMQWWYHGVRKEWYLRVWDGTAQDFRTGSGVDTTVELGFVFDYDNNEIYGIYDFGSGRTEIGRRSVSPNYLASFDSIQLLQDFRWGGSVGVQIDNILIQSSSSAVPEPSSLLLFSGLGFIASISWLRKAPARRERSRRRR